MTTVSPLTGAPLPKGGRTMGSRNRLSKKLIEDLEDAWFRDGPDALAIVAKTEPAKFLQLAFGVLPRDVLVSVIEQRVPGGLSVEDWATVVRVLDLIKASVPTDANAAPGEVFGVIEQALRARYAKPVTDARENDPNHKE
jgi:hypothetical protein